MKQIVQYQVNIKHLDDGAHFPFYLYTGHLILRGAERTDEEIREIVENHAIQQIKDGRIPGFNLEHELSDPAFINVTVYGIEVTRTIHDSENIIVEGPAKDYVDACFKNEDEVMKVWHEINERLKKEKDEQ